MVTLERCRKLLGDDAKVLSNEEVCELWEWLSMIARFSNKVDIEYKQIQ